jgi:HEAT repeat protein
MVCSWLASSPVRAAAAKVLARDPDPATTIALADAAGDKSWLVRTAALEALAIRGDPSVLDTVKLYMSDEKDVVKYTAAATFLRLTAINEAGKNKKSHFAIWNANCCNSTMSRRKRCETCC